MEENKYVKSKAFQGAFQKAGKILRDKDRLSNVLQKTQAKLVNMDGLKAEMNSFFEKVFTFSRMVKAYISGKYRDIPMRSILMIIAGLIYFITPIDFIPDFIPGIGLIDDVSVILAIFKSLIDDVNRFKLFEQGKEPDQ